MKTKFFTGKGDGGESVLGAGKIRKDSPFVEAVGALDELSAWLGFCRVGVPPRQKKELVPVIGRIQEFIFIAQAELGVRGMGQSGGPRVTSDEIAYLEEIIRNADAALPPLRHFLIGGETDLASRLDVARALARRAERRLVAWSRDNKANPELLAFMNRLSSAFFALSRYANLRAGGKERGPAYR